MTNKTERTCRFCGDEDQPENPLRDFNYTDYKTITICEQCISDVIKSYTQVFNISLMKPLIERYFNRDNPPYKTQEEEESSGSWETDEEKSGNLL